MTRKKYEVDDYFIDLKQTEESLVSHVIIKNKEAEIEQDDDIDLFLAELHKESVLNEKIEGLFFRLREHVHNNALAIFDNATLESWIEFMETNLK